MKTYTITRQDLNAGNEYIGETDLSDFDGQMRKIVEGERRGR